MFEPGQTLLNRFRVEKMLGSGGMGEVYLAWDERMEDRVALKTIARLLAPSRSIRRRFIAEVQSRYNGMPRQIVEDPELRALLIPTLRADIQIFETYRYSNEKPLSCPIIAFGGARDELVSIPALRAWSDHTADMFRLEMLDGDHFFLNSARRDLLGVIRAKLSSDLGNLRRAAP